MKEISTIRKIDFSHNQICDDCIDLLAASLSPVYLPDLQYVSLAYNNFSTKSAKPLQANLSTPISVLSYLDFSHNAFGDSIISLIIELIRKPNSHLTHCDISFCQITSKGLGELSVALPFSKHLSYLNIKGCYAQAPELSLLLQSINKIQINRNKKLNILFGGMSADGKNGILTSIPHKSLKLSLPVVSDESNVNKIHINKKLSIQSVPIVEINVMIPSFIKSPDEILFNLAIYLNAHPKQFQVKYNDYDIEINKISVQIIFSIDDFDETCITQSLSGYTTTESKYPQKEFILESILYLANTSHSFLRLLGVHSLCVLNNNQTDSIGINSRNSDLKNVINIYRAGIAGRFDVFDDYAPIVYPLPFESNRNFMENLDEDDNIFDKAIQIKEVKKSGKITGIIQSDFIFQVKPIEINVKESAIGRKSIISVKDIRISLKSDELDQQLAYLTNKTIILALRRLYESHRIESSAAKFWEGALGHIKHKNMTKRILNRSLNRSTGLYRAVFQRELLYSAMFERDANKIKDSVKWFKENGVFQGGFAYLYAERLLSEISSLQVKFQDIKSIASNCEELGLVEEFLLSCGKVGYSGPEMYEAVELRQTLLSEAIDKNNQNIISSIPKIKHKALLTNMLISRDMESLRSSLDSSPAEFLSLNESIAVQSINIDYEKCLGLLQEAISSRSILDLDNILAYMSYHYFYSESIDEAIVVLSEISKTPFNLIRKIVEGLQNDNLKMIEEGVEFANSMGLVHDSIDIALCERIIKEKDNLQHVSHLFSIE